ncbi:GNVR domain-containing protein [Desulfurispira natronophila]|uniref:LPS O-antigen subunit length determinant protein (WzzB/FepE family) n=1 Tax=Desulfurispira natronophila TaxID=682562 RepID=A0A7W7Y6F7_9BACT|nr:LPS O-antigen subunit length determinant protein (WzzB/FepE family) [Desulfurispira natronophila]
MKTPVYQARAVLEIGFYTDGNERKLVDSAQRLSRELQTVFINIPRSQDIERDAWVDSVTTVRGDNNFIELSALGISPDSARSEVARVVDYVRTEHQESIETFLESKRSDLRQLDRRISDIEERKLASLSERLDFAKEIDLPRIEQRMERFSLEIEQFQQQLRSTRENLDAARTADPALNALTIMEIRNLEDKITDRRLRLIDEQRRRDELLKSTVPDIQRDIQRVLEVELPEQFDRRELLAATIAPHNYSNTRMVGNIMSRETPVEPKKRLIVMVAFVAGFMGSIFLVFVLEFAKSFRNGKSQTDGE